MVMKHFDEIGANSSKYGNYPEVEGIARGLRQFEYGDYLTREESRTGREARNAAPRCDEPSWNA